MNPALEYREGNKTAEFSRVCLLTYTKVETIATQNIMQRQRAFVFFVPNIPDEPD